MFNLCVYIYIYIYIYIGILQSSKSRVGNNSVRTNKFIYLVLSTRNLKIPGRDLKVNKFTEQNFIIKIQKITHINLWKNSNDTIEWFRNKSKTTFIQFDMIEFYPSMTKIVIIDSSIYAKKYVEITDEQYQIILACRKTILKNNESTWVKTVLDNF